MNDWTPLALSGITLVGVLGGVIAQRRGQKDDTSLETSKWITAELRKDAEIEREKRERLEQKVQGLADQIKELRVAITLYAVPYGAEPMHTFPLGKLNGVENEDGQHIAIYIDDGPGTAATGWRRVPIEERPPIDYDSFDQEET